MSSTKSGRGVRGTDDSEPRDVLVEAINEQEAHLRQLQAEQGKVEARLGALRVELGALDAARKVLIRSTTAAPSAAAPRTAADKVKLFRQLFRGRLDVYPTRFVSSRTGKSGYAPACSNKFVPGVCELPRVKCGDCTQQAFLPFDDAAVLAHLKGQHVMGVYPMLDDETCWFLAVDFDKSTWIEDTRAFVETARGLGVSSLVDVGLRRGETAIGRGRV